MGELNHFFHVYNTLIFRILVFVTISMSYRFFNDFALFKVTHDYYLETGWTATPRALVVAVTYPSFGCSTGLSAHVWVVAILLLAISGTGFIEMQSFLDTRHSITIPFTLKVSLRQLL